jgi:DMSO/TMAO reductase YedYZ molybdopterin-dependent catalytic subunit
MDKLAIHRQGQPVRCYDFLALSALPGQEERAVRSLGGMEIGSIPLRALLGGDRCRHLTFHSEDGYATSIAWESLDECVLSYRLDARPLPRRLGGPFRVFIVGATPRSCLKYVDVIELAEQPSQEVLPVCHHDAQAAASR